MICVYYPAGFTLCNGSLWKAYPETDGQHTRRTFLDAVFHCQKENGHLATVRTEAERMCFQSVTRVIADQTPFDLRFWIGLNDIAQEGMYVWMSNYNLGTFNKGDFDWLRNQPGSKSANCVYAKSNGEFADERCSWKRFHVCQKTSSGGNFYPWHFWWNFTQGGLCLRIRVSIWRFFTM